MTLQALWVLVAFLIAWLGVITIFFFRISSHYNNLTRGSDGKGLQGILEGLVSDVSIAKKDIALVKGYCDKIEKDGELHIQKIGLVRFNPFKDTGGDQSFILAFIDKKDTGVVISGLYSRAGTRWYAKQVMNGKGVEHELSEEEKHAIKEANKHIAHE